MACAWHVHAGSHALFCQPIWSRCDGWMLHDVFKDLYDLLQCTCSLASCFSSSMSLPPI
jgi:hypothetical protein